MSDSQVIFDLIDEVMQARAQRDAARAQADHLREALQPFTKVESRDRAAYCPWCSMFADSCTCEFGQARTALDNEGNVMTDIYDEMYNPRHERDAARQVTAKARAEAARLRKVLGAIAAECLAVPQVLENDTTRRVLRIARTALDGEEVDR